MERGFGYINHVTSCSFRSMLSSFMQSTSCRLLSSRCGNGMASRFTNSLPFRANGQGMPCQAFLRTQRVIVVCLQTGNSAFLRPPPALFSACCIYGPIIGIFPANALIVEKKSPKSTNIPYNSTRKPIRGHRSSMSITPVAKAAVPFNFWRRAKKTAVFWRPIISVRPRTKRICSEND